MRTSACGNPIRTKKAKTRQRCAGKLRAKPTRARNAHICRLVNEGMPKADVAAMYRLRTVRVGQIVEKGKQSEQDQ